MTEDNRPPAKIIRNRARCRCCDDIIESKGRHDFVQCSCEAIFVDGGTVYLHGGGEPKCFEPMHEVE